MVKDTMVNGKIIKRTVKVLFTLKMEGSLLVSLKIIRNMELESILRIKKSFIKNGKMENL